ncbi:hypothetical protein MASR2M66_00700 [Chloroflexota bacterium]
MSDSKFLAETTGDWQSMDDFLRHLADRPASSFLLPHASPQETAAILSAHYAEYQKELFFAADAACTNELSLFGQTFAYSDEIDWQSDPVTKWHWPILYRESLNAFVGSTRPVDLIFFWELNRHQHFISLGIAYWLTGEQRYVSAFIRQVKNWIKTNPVQHGMNWYYPLEISIRIIAWTMAFQFFRGSPEFQQEAGGEFMKSLWQQIDFLSCHLQSVRSKDDVPNNHMIAELTGLILAGIAFPEFNTAHKWRDVGLNLLVEQVTAQTHLDGVNKEQATGYHRFVSELLLLVVMQSRRGSLKPQPILEATLEKMLNYILFSTAPTGTNQMWGDSDYGRALGLGQKKDFWDFRPLLSAGTVLFNRPDWKFVSGRFDEEAFWILGHEGMDHWKRIASRIPEQTSCAFPQGGHFVIRDSWSADSDTAFLRSGKFGLGGEGHCAHAHSDLLSFSLWLQGQPLLVDSGTYIYHGPLRDYFRSSCAHNTVMVDGHNQAAPNPNFNWRHVLNARCLNWSADHVSGIFNYRGVEFIRTLRRTGSGNWTLDDRFAGEGTHEIDWFFNFAPGLDFDLRENDRILFVTRAGSPFLKLHLPDGDFDFELQLGWYSNQYGLKQRTQKLYAQWRGRLLEDGTLFHWSFEADQIKSVSQRGEYAAAV